MSGWDGDDAVHVLQPNGQVELRGADSFNVELGEAQFRFREFFRNFHQAPSNVYIYRDALLRQYNRDEFFVEVDLGHVNEYDAALFNMIQTRPNEYLSKFEDGAVAALKLFLVGHTEQNNANIKPFQVILTSTQLPQSVRELTAEHVNKLVKVPGIIITCNKTKAKAIKQAFCCGKCGDPWNSGLISAGNTCMPPAACHQGGKECGPHPYRCMADDCEFIDHQRLRLQESPEVVPTGEMPRNVSMAAERFLVDRVSPGTRVHVIAVSSLAMQPSGQGSSAIRQSYLRVVGIQVDSGNRSGMLSMSAQDEEDMQRLARDPEIYEKLSKSIAPQISGDYTKDLKKAIACLLMGGSRKVLPDGVRLRGDINVLLMGDPSTAKSQFLKFVERVAPIGVYTSGKGSSAAGLTASVIRDSRGEFYLEGGAMVLADGGVICIDEFDKMRETDRVAIHEAMEQQTISIAKAGITTVLNSRTSVLAAANPIYGRYDDLKDVGENIDLMTTILSRFDCIFIVRDVRDVERDRSIARHVLGVHMNAALHDNAPDVEIDVVKLKKYIAYCRDRCAPRLADDAASLLSSQYVHIRNQVRQSLLNTPGEAQVVPITIRQLEALVRLSESLAKMRLSAVATTADVNEALRLFKVSTLAASQANPVLAGAGPASEDVKRCEEFLKRRLGLRMTVNRRHVVDEGLSQRYEHDSMQRAIAAMTMRGELLERNQGKLLVRVK